MGKISVFERLYTLTIRVRGRGALETTTSSRVYHIVSSYREIHAS